MDFDLPKDLVEVCESDFWPQTTEDVNRQETHPFVRQELVKTCFQDEEKIVFYRQPFYSAVEHAQNNGSLSVANCFADGCQLKLDNIIILGDFGHGSDIHFGLYYENEQSTPVVVKENRDYSVEPDRSWWSKEFNSFSSFLKAMQIQSK